MKTITITRERPDTADAQMLINELERHLAGLYPIQSRHGLSVARLLEERVAFFVLRYADDPAGCGGVQCFGKEYAELKRMYVRPDYRRKGLGDQIVKHLEAYAQAQGIGIIRLETGIYQEAAIRLYERMGYQKIPPFGDYEDGPHNLFYEKAI
jgi:putative acetyltransferase